MARLRVLITGAGVGGSALAFWLAKLNHDVTVLERYPALRVNGLQLDLRGFGIEVMKRMGLEKEVRAKLVPEEGVAVVDSKGRRRAYFAANKSGSGAQSITSEFEIMRRDICQILHDAAIKNGAKYMFGTYVESFEELNGVVTVKLADGQTKEYDLVVGADGLGSRLRRLMLTGPDGKTQDSLVDLTQRTAYFTMKKPIQPDEAYIGQAYMIPGKRFMLLRRHSPEEMQVYLGCDNDSKATEGIKNMKRGDAKSEKAAFAEIFRGQGWRTDEIVRVMEEAADDWYVQYTGFVKMDRWSKGHVTLVGDAAHGAPADGMGTSAALVGAYILGGEIERHYGRGDTLQSPSATENEIHEKGTDRLVAAIEAYEAKYQPYIKQIHKDLKAEPDFFDKLPWTQFTINVVMGIAWLICALRLDQLMMSFAPIEGVKGWDLPEYNMVRT